MVSRRRTLRPALADDGHGLISELVRQLNGFGLAAEVCPPCRGIVYRCSFSTAMLGVVLLSNPVLVFLHHKLQEAGKLVAVIGDEVSLQYVMLRISISPRLTSP